MVMVEEKEKEEEHMASKLFEAIRGIVSTSEFETYFERVQLAGMRGAPTVEEAKRDYQALLEARASGLTN